MPQPTALGFSVTAEEIRAYNDAYLSRFYSGSAVSDAASLSGLRSLQALHEAIASNTVVKNNKKLAEWCRNDILQHFFRDEKEKPKLTDQKIIERLNEKYDPKSIQRAMGKILTVLTKPQLDQASFSQLETLSDFAAVTVYAQYGMDLFFEYIPLNTFIHNPGLINLLNAASDPEAPIRDQGQILKQIIDALFAETIYSIDNWIGHDINPRKLRVLLQTEDTKGLVNELEKYEAIDVKGLQLLSTIAKALIEAKSSRELLDKIQKPLNDYQMEWFKQFGLDILRTGGQGSFIIDDPYHTAERIQLTFSVLDNKVQVSKIGAKTGNSIVEPQVLREILANESKEYVVALAVADYLKNEYKMPSELIAHILLTGHQSSFMGTVLTIRGNLLAHQDKEKVSIRTIPTRSLLQLNSNGQLTAIEQEIPFELISCIKQVVDGKSYKEGEKIKTLGTLTTKRNGFNKLVGNLPLGAYLPGVFPPFEGEVSYLSNKNSGLLTVSRQSVFTSLFTSKLMLNIRRHPIKASLFFIMGCLITALGVAAWPVTVAFLSGASIAGAVAAVATFVTALSMPALAGVGAGTLGSGLLTMLLSGLFMKLQVKQPVRLLQENSEYAKNISTSVSVIPTSSVAVALKQLSQSELDELRMVIQLIKEGLAPNGKATTKDLALLATKEAVQDELKSYLESLMASDGTSSKLMSVFENLLESAKVKSQNINPKMPEAFIKHLEALQLEGLKTVIAQMKDKLPKTPGNSPRSAGSSPGRDEIQQLAPSTPVKDRAAARRNLPEGGDGASSTPGATNVSLPGKTNADDYRTPMQLVS